MQKLIAVAWSLIGGRGMGCDVRSPLAVSGCGSMEGHLSGSVRSGTDWVKETLQAYCLTAALSGVCGVGRWVTG
jgi:hypothetical protein